MKNLEFKPFSIKKLLLTILCTVIVSVFLGTTISFVLSTPTWIYSEVLTGMENTGIEKNKNTLNEMVENYKYGFEKIEKKISEDKNLYGEDYPAEEVFLILLINRFSSYKIMEVYAISVLIGIVLGTIIYIVALQNIKGKQVVIELILAFVVLFIFITLLNLGYQAIINKLITDLNTTNVTYDTYIYDLESYNILIPYILVAVTIYIVNMVRQKIITNKLNKQLNTK